jgi:hypothetical protein
MNVHKSHVLLFAAAISSILTVATLDGQVVSASLEGIIQDASGAVVPSAKVQVINTGTNVQNAATTNTEGRFFLPSLQPGGPYTVVIEAPGFKREERAGITLEVNQSARINIQLQVGAASETVKVTADEDARDHHRLYGPSDRRQEHSQPPYESEERLCARLYRARRYG